MRTPLRAVLPLLALGACVRDVGPGPDLGDCADYPDGVWAFGEAGIGTCLAGPTDLQFLRRDLRTWWVIANADPFRNYRSGSLLLLAADSVDLRGGDQDIAQLEAHALEMEHFVGRFGLAPDGDLAIVPSRFSQDAFVIGADDRAWVVDLADPTAPTYLDERRLVGAEADPYGTVVDPDARRAYLLHGTDVSLGVVDLGVRPPEPLDVAAEPVVTEPVASISAATRAEVAVEPLDERTLPLTDTWTVTWLPGTVRVWAPDGPEGAGRARFTSGGLGYTRAGLGLDLDPEATEAIARFDDPWLGAAGDALAQYYVDRGAIRVAESDGSAGDWFLSTAIAMTGQSGTWRGRLGGPSVLAVDGRQVMLFDGRPAEGEADAERGQIGWATTVDGVRFTPRANPVISPDAGVDALAQPSALLHPVDGSLRVWMSVRRPDGWGIGLSTSLDGGETFSTPEPVFPDEGEAGAPVVQWDGRRFVMWFAHRPDAGSAWAFSRATSLDGVTWQDVEPVLDADDLDPTGLDDDRPPRLSVQLAQRGTWRLEGLDSGRFTESIPEGDTFVALDEGFQVRVASGFAIGTTDVFDADGGVTPGVEVDVDGVPTLYATATDDQGVDRLVALRRTPSGWAAASDDLVPTGAGGNVDGASDPVVWFDGARWQLVYTAFQDGVGRLRRATSDDGLDFTPVDAPALPDPAGWASVAQRAHSLVEEDGTWVLWYAGFDGRRHRIARATAPLAPLGEADRFAEDPGLADPWVFEPGEPGTFDDSGVKDPAVRVDGDRVEMVYAGFDGDTWSLGEAVSVAGGPFERTTDPTTGRVRSALPAFPGSFAGEGTSHPVLTDDGVWYAGDDGQVMRIGQATVADGLFQADLTPPAPGDQLTFRTLRGRPGRSTIPLDVRVDGFPLPGITGSGSGTGPADGILDRTRGFLYLLYPSFPAVVVVDVRDDSSDGFVDANVQGVEAVMRFQTTTGSLGFRGGALVGADTLYLAARDPDGVVAVDLTQLVDDDVAQLYDETAVAVLPMHDVRDDAGETTFASVGASGVAWVPGLDLLLVPHFRDNSVSVFDLEVGAYGEEVRVIREVGENPHLVRVSPDGTYAVVANYLGPSDEERVLGPTLSVIDLVPSSPTFLEVTARIRNR